MPPEIDIDVRLGGVLSFTVQPTSVDVVIMQGGGKLAGWSLRDASGTLSQSVSGNVVAPAAGADIAALTGVPAGTYTVSWTVALQGAAAAGEANNFQLYDTAGNVIASVNPGAAGEYIQPSVEVTVAAGAKIAVKAIGVGTAAVTYSADIAISPTIEVETVVEFQDGPDIKGEVAFVTKDSSTEHFGPDGPPINRQLLLHVASGIVTGCVYFIPSRGSQ
jgi:hypothetical protein